MQPRAGSGISRCRVGSGRTGGRGHTFTPAPGSGGCGHGCVPCPRPEWMRLQTVWEKSLVKGTVLPPATSTLAAVSSAICNWSFSGQVMSVCISRPSGLEHLGQTGIGAVAVFHDITELMRLERVRRDFRLMYRTSCARRSRPYRAMQKRSSAWTLRPNAAALARLFSSTVSVSAAW